MHLVQSLPFLLLGLIPVAAGSNGKNYFTSPATNTGINPVYTIGDKLLISWETTLGEFNVSFWQQSLVQQSAASQGNIYAKIHSSDHVTNFTWVVQLYGFDLSYSNVFFLWINPDGPDGFTSTYFNISEPTSTTTTATISSSTSGSTLNLASVSSSALASYSSPSSSPSSSATTSSNNTTPQSTTLTTTSKIALGVGVGVGIPILCALGILIWLKARKSNTTPDNNTNTRISAPIDTSPAWRSTRQHQSPGELYSKDVPGSGMPGYVSELPNSPYR